MPPPPPLFSPIRIMHTNHPQSSTTGDASTAWRISTTIPGPVVEQTDLPPSDLGSDDDWHLTMGSDSDPSDPAEVLSPSNPDNDASPPIPQDHSQPTLDYDLHDDDDHLPQPAIIPGYRGVNTRAAVAESLPSATGLHFDTSANDLSRTDPAPQSDYVSQETSGSYAFPDPCALGSNWADRPRHQRPVEGLAAQTTPSKSSAKMPPNSDSARSVPHTGSSASGSAFHLSPRSFSDTSDASRKTPSKSVSFVDSQPPPRAIDESHDPAALWANAASSSAPNSTRSSSPLQMAEFQSPDLQTSLKEGKVRSAAARFGAPKRFQRRFAPAARATKLSSNHSSGASSTQGSSFVRSSNSRPLQWGQSPAAGLVSQRPTSTQSEGLPYPRVSSALSQQSNSNERSLSTPNQRVLDCEATSDSDNSGVFFKKTTVKYSGVMQMASINFSELKIWPLCQELSFLECVVELLRGSHVLKRKNFLNASDAWIWLTSDLTAVKFRTAKKGAAPVVHTLPLGIVSKLRGNDRDISLEMLEEKKALNFVFSSRERADIWMSGLSCLLPAHATVRVKNRKWLRRETYDPLLDNWEGRPLTARKRLGDYILLGSIGKGSFGKVRLAFMSTDRQFFAVKVLSKLMMRKQSRIGPLARRIGNKNSIHAQFSMTDVNEIAVLRHLNHVNVMRMKGVFDVNEEDKLFIVVEFLPNGPIMSSSKLTGAQPLSENRARSVFVDVLNGLEYLHYKKVAHRDIKPDNLLVAGDGTVKISDFGAAVLYGDDDGSDGRASQLTSSTVGTPAFTAPELCGSDKSPPCPRRCFAADIWSMGATVFYMVYGRAPFIARSVFEMYDAICSTELQFPETPLVSKSLKVLIKKMLVKDPRERATLKEIAESPWLTGNVDVAEKVEVLQRAIERHESKRTEGNATESKNNEA